MDSRVRVVLIALVLAALVGIPSTWAAESTSKSLTVAYAQPAGSSGQLLQSSRWDRDGSDYDAYVWDSFVLSSTQWIGEIDWRGGYDPAKARSGGKLTDFRVAIYGSRAANTQPDVVGEPLMEYRTGGTAGESPAGTFGRTEMYDYHFVLPTPFRAEAGTKYWVQIEAIQDGIPHWGIAVGTGGDGRHFRRTAGAGDFRYQSALGDASFSLIVAP